MFLENRGGPSITVRIGNMVVTTVACGSGAEIAPGLDNAPPLPWQLTITRDVDGSTLVAERVTELPWYFTQIGGDQQRGSLSAFPIAGLPGPTCAPPQ